MPQSSQFLSKEIITRGEIVQSLCHPLRSRPHDALALKITQPVALAQIPLNDVSQRVETGDK